MNIIGRKFIKNIDIKGIFFIWAFRRGLGSDASKRRKHTFTDQRWETLSPPAAPSGIRPYNPLYNNNLQFVPGQKHFRCNP